MRTISIRIASFLAAALFAVAMSGQVENKDYDLGGGGGADSCKVCHGSAVTNPDGTGYLVMSCGSPESGGWGKSDCWIDSYPEGSYCFNEGNNCCVD
jgi:hypothetical protein